MMPWGARSVPRTIPRSAAAEDDDETEDGGDFNSRFERRSDGRAVDVLLGRRDGELAAGFYRRRHAPHRSLPARARDGTETVSCLSDPTRSSLVSLGV